MEKINIAELLKDCPKGMELDCTMFYNVRFDHVDASSDYPIVVAIGGENNLNYLTEYGEWNGNDMAKCIIFPKGKTTWEGFVPPCQFKDEDVVTCGNLSPFSWTCILKETPEKIMNNYFISDYCSLDSDGEFLPYDSAADNVTWIRLATEEEKQKLFDAIKAHGYNWNIETKTLEKLVKTNFESGEEVDDRLVTSDIYFDREYYADEVELHLDNYEIEIHDGKTYATLKKLK